MSIFSEPLVVLAWVTRLTAIGVVVDSAERVAAHKVFSDTALLSWPWLRSRRRPTRIYLFDRFLAYPNYLFIMLLRLVAAICLLLWPLDQAVTLIALPIALAGGMLTHLRNRLYEITASHRMSVLILSVLLLRSLVPNSLLVNQIALWFIALQVCLSYAVAGWFRIHNKRWREGSTLAISVRVHGIRSGDAARLLANYPTLGRILTWGVWAIECTFPLALVLPPPITYAYLAGGLAMHLANAYFFGFNKFVWCWPAAYPAVIYAASMLTN